MLVYHCLYIQHNLQQAIAAAAAAVSDIPASAGHCVLLVRGFSLYASAANGNEETAATLQHVQVKMLLDSGGRQDQTCRAPISHCIALHTNAQTHEHTHFN